MKVMKLTTVSLLMLSAVLSIQVSALDAPQSPADTLKAARDLEMSYILTIKKVLPAYVFLDGGSGVLISADGYFLTNHHVIRNKKTAQVRSNGKDYDAKTVGVDAEGDIALLKMENVSKMPFLEFADSDSLHVGQQVFAIGNPFDTAEVSDDPTVTTGIVSALHRYEGNYTDAIQTDAAVNPGNSGGPLVTLDGKLAGINGLIETKFGNAANTGVALAIPAKQIERFLPKLKAAGGKIVHHGSIRGLNKDVIKQMAMDAYTDDTESMRDGAEVKSIAVGSPAEKLGLKAGDKIVKIDNYPLLNFVRFMGVINTYPAGSEIKLTYQRDGATKTAMATLEESTPGKLGIEMEIPTGPRAANVMPPTIARIEPNSAAAKAGIKPGDLILSINGKSMTTLREVRKFMRESVMYAGDVLKLKVRRGSKEKPEDVEVVATLIPSGEVAKVK